MSHPFDAALKEIMGQKVRAFAPVRNLPADLPARALNVDLSTISAATDAAFGFGEPLSEIAGINFQSGPDAKAAFRVAGVVDSGAPASDGRSLASGRRTHFRGRGESGTIPP
jgi:hypothetical protein